MPHQKQNLCLANPDHRQPPTALKRKSAASPPQSDTFKSSVDLKLHKAGGGRRL